MSSDVFMGNSYISCGYYSESLLDTLEFLVDGNIYISEGIDTIEFDIQTFCENYNKLKYKYHDWEISFTIKDEFQTDYENNEFYSIFGEMLGDSDEVIFGDLYEVIHIESGMKFRTKFGFIGVDIVTTDELGNNRNIYGRKSKNPSYNKSDLLINFDWKRIKTYVKKLKN